MNLADILLQQARLRPDAPAIVAEGTQLTYQQLDRLCWRVCAFLQQHGIQKGQVVACSLQSDLVYALVMLGLARVGATLFSLPENFPPLRQQMLARAVGASLLLRDHDRCSHLELPNLNLELDELLATRPTQPEHLRDPSPIAPWLIVTGSGSTGRPHCMCISHKQQIDRLKLSSHWLNCQPGERVTTLVRWFFTTTKNRFWETLFAGSCFVLPGTLRQDPLALCQHMQLDVLHATVPHMIAALTAANRPSMPEPTRRLRMLSMTSSIIEPALRQSIHARLGSCLHIRYAVNEGGTISVATPSQALNDLLSVGVPLPGVQVQIVDASGQPLPTGEQGLIRFRMPGMLDGYMDDPGTSARTFRQGWCYPGDLGSLATDGTLRFHGRADDMMIISGVNLYPSEVEAVMRRHPAIRDAFVMAMPESPGQNDSLAVLSPEPSAQVILEHLKQHAWDHLGLCMPSHYLFIAEMPRDERGKLQRHILLPWIREQLASRVTETASSPG
jgi:acyl-coenzyme A synthetase/AMP-(fatty) acid ligase